ncbi:MAG: DUF1573 domain-containing protein [Flavobacteriales bacterium]
MKNKRTLWLIFTGMAMAFCSCNPAPKSVNSDMIHFGSDSAQAPVMTFDSLDYHFGTIAIGERVTHTFHFENTGASPLIIAQVHPSCGCTVPKSWPTEPIAPGDGGDIIVEFNSNGNPGAIRKYVSVQANSIPRLVDLHLIGEVIGKEAPPAPKQGMEMEFERK